MRDYLRRLAVPIGAYLVITLVLPAANGAASHHEFLNHAMWVVLGCALVVGAIAMFGVLANVSLAGARRLKNTRAPADKSGKMIDSSRVSPRGQP